MFNCAFVEDFFFEALLLALECFLLYIRMMKAAIPSTAAARSIQIHTLGVLLTSAVLAEGTILEDFSNALAVTSFAWAAVLEAAAANSLLVLPISEYCLFLAFSASATEVVS